LVIVTFNLLVSQELPRVGYGTLLDQFIVVALVFTGVGVCEYCLISFLSSSWLATQSDKPVQWRAAALAIEQWCRVTMAPAWLVVALCFFTVPRPAASIVIVVGCVLIASVALVVARRTYRVALSTLLVKQQQQQQQQLQQQQGVGHVCNDTHRRKKTSKR
jgi:cytochrome bd-type quinol oxidase subunit 2